MKILVINSGSSSLKYQVLDMDSETALAKGLVERIGLPGAMLTHHCINGEKEVMLADIPNHDRAIQLLFEAITDPEYGIVKALSEIDAVGHRVLHGGEKVTGSVLITPEVKEAIRECFEFAPLHNPANLAGINACEKLMPDVPQVAVFDNAFHQTMTPEAYLYGIPYEYYEKYKIRRYGFHGTSHKYVSQRAAEMLGGYSADFKVISCHLGNGSSISAIKAGKCLDTSMGMTPLEGLMMGTRSGDIDPAVVAYIQNKENLTPDEVNEFLNKKSGVLGLSGISSDFRDLQIAADEGNSRAKLAIDAFAYHVKKYVGAYAAILDGTDALIFTAGLGENSPSIRQQICSTLGFLGLKIDPLKNEMARGREMDIATPESQCRVLVIPTNEELMIALDTKEVLRKLFGQVIVLDKEKGPIYNNRCCV
ncbi:acetate kinase [Syntrophobotulus glycolicus DSM 8271]|uniref:Acetate kinase n=1 Tax=Syntrophobotulus glycolicus (strain DSM 8271 / FlGlyR) TaxID=645991 RepID=F0SUF5_SYNGF|nr:acetate kinase [Syntrophobotulus glycolicus DSM 8271]